MSLSKKRGLYETNRIIYLPINEILPNPDQPRKNFDPDGLKELAISIARYGVLQPLSVRRRGRSFELVAGERRLRASVLAGLQEVPCIILDIDVSDSSILALIENLQRRDLDFIEEAEGLNQLIRLYGMSQEDIARRIGKSQSSVANKLRILKLPKDILYTIREAGLTERHARALLRLPGNDLRAKALETILHEHMNVAAAELYIEGLLEPQPPPKEPTVAKGPAFRLKDVRLFLNTVNRSLDVMKRAGIDASCGTNETEQDIVLTIHISKKPKQPATLSWLYK